MLNVLEAEPHGLADPQPAAKEDGEQGGVAPSEPGPLVRQPEERPLLSPRKNGCSILGSCLGLLRRLLRHDRPRRSIDRRQDFCRISSESIFD